MAKTKISEFSSTPANNTDIDSINIAEGCAPSGINDAIRELMAQLKDFQTGAVGDSFNGPIGTSTAAAGAFTTLSATGAITSTLATGTAPLVIASTTKVANLNVDLLDGADWAAPAALGSTTPAAGSFTTLGASSTATLNTLVSSGATLTGGTINGMTIGATTASTGAFTTLSASSTVTLSGGTANGVAYLNGSKVVTSGSALTFDGTGFQLSTSTGGNFYLNSTTTGTSNQIVSLLNNGNGYGNLNYKAFDHIWSYGATEQMRLTSTGLGIGTSTVGARLTTQASANSYVAGALQINSLSGTYKSYITNVGGLLLFSNSSTVDQLILDSSGNLGIGTSSPSDKLQVTAGGLSTILTGNDINFTRSGVSYITATGAGSSLAFGTNNTVSRMVLDSSGNLGLGVTPSAWNSFKAIQLNTGGSLAALTNQLTIGSNWYYGSGDRYVISDYATAYSQNSGIHKWFTAPSGTAGNAITFTQAMTLDASGNLMVGGTSNDGRRLTIMGNTNDLSGIGITYIGVAASSIAVNSSGALTFNLNNSDGKTERARIDSSGNFLVGTSTNRLGEKLHVLGNGIVTSSAENTNMGLFGTFGSSNLIIGAFSNLPVEFRQNNTERARIDSSGNLLIGKTSADDSIGGFSYYGASKYLSLVRDNSPPLYINRLAADGAVVEFARSTTLVGTISVTTTATAYNTSSDYRLKNTIAPMTGALAKVAALKPVTYKWNADGSDGEGFIAHELAEVVPQAVTGEKDAVDEEGNPKYQGIDTSFLVATLTAAIQELKAEFDAYKASHP